MRWKLIVYGDRDHENILGDRVYGERRERGEGRRGSRAVGI